MGRACSTYGGGRKYVDVGCKYLKRRHLLVDLGVDGRIILKYIVKGCVLDSYVSV
jgi:hypothetical protein